MEQANKPFKLVLPEIKLQNTYGVKRGSVRFGAGRWWPDPNIGKGVLDLDATTLYDITRWLIDLNILLHRTLYQDITKIQKLKSDIERSYNLNAPLIDINKLPVYYQAKFKTRRRPGDNGYNENDPCDYEAYTGYFGSGFLERLKGNPSSDKILNAAASKIYAGGDSIVPINEQQLISNGINPYVAKYVTVYYYYARLAQLLNVLIMGFNPNTHFGGTEAAIKSGSAFTTFTIPNFKPPTLTLDLPANAVSTLMKVVPSTADEIKKLGMAAVVDKVLKASKAIINQ